jgi:hypothetical protein
LIIDGYPRRIATAYTEDHSILQLSQGNEVVTPWQSRREAVETVTNNEALITNLTSSNRPSPPPITEIDTTRDSGDEDRALTSHEPVKAVIGIFPISNRPPTHEEAKVIRALKGKGESLNAICRKVYGGKNDKILQWVKDVLEEESSEVTETNSLPESLDLTTETGRATLEKLQASGLVKWPDANTLLNQ